MTRSSKIKLNIAAVMISLVIGIIFFLIRFWLVGASKDDMEQNLINDVGAYFINTYQDNLHNKVNSAISSLKKANDSEAFNLLDDWVDIKKQDRAYPIKRRLYVELSKHLHTTQEFEEMLKLSKLWLDSDNRDVTGMAFYYEAMRNIPDYQEEGLLGLVAQYERCPSNHMLRTFLQYAANSGNLEAKEILYKFKPRSDGWGVFWYKSEDFSGQGMKLGLTAQNEKDDHYNLSVAIPKGVVILRIDPPMGEPLRLVDISLTLKDQSYSIPSGKINLVRMERNEDWLVTPGDKVSFIYFDSEYIFKNVTEKQINVTFHFRMILN